MSALQCNSRTNKHVAGSTRQQQCPVHGVKGSQPAYRPDFGLPPSYAETVVKRGGTQPKKGVVNLGLEIYDEQLSPGEGWYGTEFRECEFVADFWANNHLSFYDCTGSLSASDGDVYRGYFESLKVSRDGSAYASQTKRFSMQNGGHAEGIKSSGSIFIASAVGEVIDCEAERYWYIEGTELSSHHYTAKGGDPHLDIRITAPGQVILNLSGDKKPHIKISYPPETTLVLGDRISAHDYDLNAAVRTEVATLRSLVLRPQDDSEGTWLDARNLAAWDFVRNAGGFDAKTGDVDEETLAIARRLHQNPA